jgi:hypothetical protein
MLRSPKLYFESVRDASILFQAGRELDALCRFFSMCAAASLVAACDVDLSGLNQLFDTDPTYLSLPGRRIASGNFFTMRIGGTDAEGPYVLAYEKIDDERTLAIMKFDGSSRCNAGPTDGFRPFLFGVRNTLPLAFPFTRTVDKVRSLHFAGPDCSEVADPVPDSGLPFWPMSPIEDPPGYLTLAGGGDFLMVRPWENEQKTLAEGVRLIVPKQERFYSLERHPDALDEAKFQLVVRDLDLKEVGRVGEDVKELDVVDGDYERAAYVENGNLYVTKKPFEESTLADSDACAPAFPGGFRGRGLSYFSPCDEKELRLYGSARLSDPGPGKSDLTHVLRGPAVGDPSIGYLGNSAYVFFATTDGGDPETQTLWGGRVGGGIEAIGTAPQLTGSGAPRLSTFADQQQFQFVLDYADGVGRLVRWGPKSPLTELLTGVEECVGPICISNYDGTTGDAIYVNANGTTRKVASGVPSRGISSDPDDGFGIISDFDGTTGTLLVSDTAAKNFDVIARKVTPGGYWFLANLKAVAYLRDYDDEDGTGSFGVRVIETGDTFDSGIRASEFEEVGWPQPGLMYLVPNGDDAGIWFAALK